MPPPALEGIIIAKANGVASGATFHQPSIFSVVFSDAAELTGCVLEKVKKIFGGDIERMKN